MAIYGVLSRSRIYSNLRVFGANFLWSNMRLCYLNCFLQLCLMCIYIVRKFVRVAQFALITHTQYQSEHFFALMLELPPDHFDHFDNEEQWRIISLFQYVYKQFSFIQNNRANQTSNPLSLLGDLFPSFFCSLLLSPHITILVLDQLNHRNKKVQKHTLYVLGTLAEKKRENVGILKKKQGGRGRGSPTWEKFPNFTVFFC